MAIIHSMNNVGGRPTVITKDAVRKLEQAFKDGLSVSEACFVSGIGKRTFYGHNATDARFAHQMELAKTYVTLRAKKVVVQAIDGGNLTAAKWYLERKARNEFGSHPVEEDAEWGKQAETNAQEDKLFLILESMSAIAKEARQETASHLRGFVDRPRRGLGGSAGQSLSRAARSGRQPGRS